jgi:hypothetical protein
VKKKHLIIIGVALIAAIVFVVTVGFRLGLAQLFMAESRAVNRNRIRPWDDTPSPNIRGTNALAGVSAFIATYGWNSSTNDEDLDRWEDLQPHYIRDLPWTQYKGRKFQALTYDGILYVLSNPGWHHDYGGVAYNPTTNRFPALMLNGFKPIGGHWYVWCSLEFNPQGLPKIYE